MGFPEERLEKHPSGSHAVQLRNCQYPYIMFSFSHNGLVGYQDCLVGIVLFMLDTGVLEDAIRPLWLF